MRIEPFAMERWQSTWEHRVAFNLSESGVHPLSVAELLALEGESPAPAPDALVRLRLGYMQGNGAAELRERIALVYPGADIENVLVTTGSSEANFLAALVLLEPGDLVAFMTPNYLQLRGLAVAWGGAVTDVPLREELGWEAEPDDLDRAITKKTKLVVVTNPNNPTGKVLGPKFLDRVAAAASRVGAWVLSDEVYRGAERDGDESPSFWERYDRLLVTGGLSKAYGLPGLRVGWVVSPDRSMIEKLWSYHDYSTICPTTLSEALATAALDPLRRRKILERTRGILRENFPVIRAWADQGAFAYHPPDAGAILWVRYEGNEPSAEIAKRLRAEEDVLVVPGAHFGMEGYLRLGYGLPGEKLAAALERVTVCFRR
ncbi:MAG: aminotransferase class I/II-fold pyridoxal phosphate-dependent enzyme [Candidatus Eisenbacteria bacterium]